MTASRPIFARRDGHARRRRRIGLAVMAGLAVLWLAAASRVHVNASWSDEAWGYAAFPLFGVDLEIGDRVLFEPAPRWEEQVANPESAVFAGALPAWPPGSGAGAGSPRSGLPYLKTVRGLPGMRIEIGQDRTVFLDGEPVGRAKTHALDGRTLSAVAPGVIPPGHYFLHADHPDSHDSRYAEIGLVPRARILGRAVALPDLPWIGLKGPLVGPEDARPAETSETRR